MFEDWKHAWRSAVDNFYREMNETDEAVPGDHARAMRRDFATARGALDRLEEELLRARRDHVAEQQAEEVCRRRESLARGIGDEETVRVAMQFAQRHAERVELLARKVGVLHAERTLLERDVTIMQEAIAAAPVPSGAVDSGAGQDEHEFRRMQRAAREAAADQKLEELKRRMK